LKDQNQTLYKLKAKWSLSRSFNLESVLWIASIWLSLIESVVSRNFFRTTAF